MNETPRLRVVARIQSDFKSKFGVPRQSCFVMGRAVIVFEPEYRDDNALRGIEGSTHLWLLWGFHKLPESPWSPTVKPPRLGGNKRLGVFATRSPNRPNRIGLSCVKLVSVVRRTGEGTVLVVEGADLVDGTPIYDIKPYIPVADCHPEAQAAWTDAPIPQLKVNFPQELLAKIPEEKQAGLLSALEQDPRPAYHKEKVMDYGMAYADWDVRFRVHGNVLTVFEVAEAGEPLIKAADKTEENQRIYMEKGGVIPEVRLPSHFGGIQKEK